jgi:hypothetical protein
MAVKEFQIPFKRGSIKMAGRVSNKPTSGATGLCLARAITSIRLVTIRLVTIVGLGCASVVCSNNAFANPTQEVTRPTKHAIPDKSEQREKSSVIRDIFADQYKDHSIAGQSKLADDLLETARQTKDDPVGQFVLFSEALQVAIESGNVPAACQSSDQLIQRFEVEPAKIQTDLVEGLSKTLKNPDDWDQLKSYINRQIDEQIKTNEFKSAEQLLGSLNKGARRTNDTFLVETTLSRIKALKGIARQFGSVKSQLKKLELNPDDATANQAVGEFRCFWKQDFEKGLTNLAKGTDQQMQALASAELDGFSDNAERIRAANQWWTIGENLRGDQSKSVIAHAVDLYHASVEEAQGVEKKQIELRISQFQAMALAGLPANIKAVFGKPWRITWANGHATWEKTVFSENGAMRSFAQNRIWKNTFVIDNNMLRILRVTKEFVFTIEFYGQSLVCRKFDAKTGQLLDQGTGVLLKQ